MKNFLIILALTLVQGALTAQSMKWVPAGEAGTSNLVDRTNCEDNVVCYALAYTPAKSGVLTSYTTNFLVDCDAGGSAVVRNASATMSDKSQQMTDCEGSGKLLLNSSGNTGDLLVKAGRIYYLHEICLQTARRGASVDFAADVLGGMTTSLNRPGEEAITERPYFAPDKLWNNTTRCTGVRMDDVAFDGDLMTDDNPEGSLSLLLSPNPTADQLTIRLVAAPGEVDFRLLDATGRQLRTWKASSELAQQIDVSELPAGAYYLSAGPADETLTRKFIIQR